MPLDPSIPLQAQTPSIDSALRPISSLLGIQGQIQGLQQGQQALQSNQIDLQEKQAVQRVLSNPQQFMDGNKNFDWNKLTPAIMSVAPVNGPRYIAGIFATQQQATQAQQSINSMDADKRAQVGQFLTSMVGKDPATINAGLNSLKSTFPNLSNVVDFFGQKILGPAIQSGDQSKIDDALWRAGKSIEAPQTQQAMSTPGGIPVSNNQQTAVISTKPGTAVPQGAAIPGTAQQLQLPPTTPTINPQNNQPGYLGPQSSSKFGTPSNLLDAIRTQESGGDSYAVNKQSGAMGPYQFMPATVAMLHKEGLKFDPFDPQQARDAADYYMQKLLQQNGGDMQKALAAYGGFKGKDPSAYINGVLSKAGNQGFVPSAPAPGVVQNIENNVQEMNRHYAALNDQSSGAPLVTALTGNIKSLAKGAVTGTESGRKAYLNGLLNAFGLGNQATGDMQKDTDLLEKQMAQLNLSTPASTDAARTLVSAARPHQAMNEGAIMEAADQIASQVKANMAMRNFLSPYKLMGDVSGYTAARQKLEQVADPRAWQYLSLGPGTQAAKDFLKKLQPNDRQQLIQNTGQLEQMGLLK